MKGWSKLNGQDVQKNDRKPGNPKDRCPDQGTGKKERNLTDHIGIALGALSKWKYDGSYVYIKYIYEICEFLGTTPNYLFFVPEDEDKELSLKEKEMI